MENMEQLPEMPGKHYLRDVAKYKFYQSNLNQT
jgi:hypothetical protein